MGADDVAMLGSPAKHHLLPWPRFLDADLIVQPVHREPLTGRQQDDQLRDRPEVDDIDHGATDVTRSVGSLTRRELDPLGSHGDRRALAGSTLASQYVGFGLAGDRHDALP